MMPPAAALRFRTRLALPTITCRASTNRRTSIASYHWVDHNPWRTVAKSCPLIRTTGRLASKKLLQSRRSSVRCCLGSHRSQIKSFSPQISTSSAKAAALEKSFSNSTSNVSGRLADRVIQSPQPKCSSISCKTRRRTSIVCRS